MIEELKESEFGLEGTLECPLFSQPLDVLIDGAGVEYAQRCAAALCTLPEETLLRLCRYSVRYCEWFRSLVPDVDIGVPEGTEGRAILEHIFPGILIVTAPEDGRVGYSLELGCDWEPEHGLEWTILDGKVKYVGPYESTSPWDDMSYTGFYQEGAELNMNFADQE